MKTNLFLHFSRPVEEFTARVLVLGSVLICTVLQLVTLF